jgi:uncharacterized protein (TIGR00304 family)
MDAGALSGLGIALIFAGMLAILAAILLLFLSSATGGGKAKGAGAIIIGPVPIVFGTDKESIRMVLLLSIILTALLITATVIIYLLRR